MAAIAIGLAVWPARGGADTTQPERAASFSAGLIRLERGNGLWLIVSNNPAAGEPAGYRLVHRREGGGWDGHWRSGSGAVTAAAAVGDSLFLIFSGGDIARYDGSGEASPVLQPGPELWPGDTRALAASAYGAGEALLLLVNRPRVQHRPQPASRLGSTPATTRSATSAAAKMPTATASREGVWAPGMGWNALPRQAEAPTRGATAPARGDPHAMSRATQRSRYDQLQTRPRTFPVLREMALLTYRAGQWTELAALDEPALNWPAAAIRPQGQAVYVLLQRPGAALLLRWGGPAAADDAWQPVPLPPSLPPDSIFALLLTQWTSGAQMPTLASLPQAGQIVLQRYSGQEGWKRAELAVPGAQAPIAAAGAGAVVNLAWLHEGVQYATLSGDQLREGPAPVEVRQVLSQAEVLRLLQGFMSVLLGLAVVLMFLPGKPARTRPFSLPDDMPPAGFLRRAAAAILDVLIMSFAGSLLMLFTDVDPEMDLTRRMGSLPAQAVYVSIGVMIAYIVYGAMLEYILGATLGKLAFGLRVVGEQGRRPTLRETAVRNVTKLPELVAFMTIIPILFPLFSRYRQRLGDWIASTAVVEAKAWRQPSQDDSPQRPEDPHQEKL